ncbi:MAG: hypothetical protein J5J00_02940 [Deltaproteobacteria bacterium]|nr:hypothetical protein [Deltaproteobacteria bacterium]
MPDSLICKDAEPELAPSSRSSFPWLILLAAFFLSRVSFLIVGVLQRDYSIFLAPHEGGWTYAENSLIGIWTGWDSGAYLSLAVNGYEKSRATADIPLDGFLPLFPYLASVCSSRLEAVLVTGLLISNLGFLLAGITLYELLEPRWGRSLAFRSALLLFINPFSFYGSCFLTEGVFCFLLISAFFFGQRGAPLPCVAACSMLAVTRMIGIVLAPIIIASMLYSRRIRGIKLLLCSTALSLVAYLPLLAHIMSIRQQTGEWLRVFTIHKIWGRLAPEGPVSSFMAYIQANLAAA